MPGGFSSFAPAGTPASRRPLHLLGANESPFPPPAAVVEAIAVAAASANRYPEPTAAGLTARIGMEFGVPEDRIVVGPGSAALLQSLFQAVAEPGAEAVFAWRSFEVYPILAELAAVRGVQVPLLDAAHDVSAMIGRVTAHTRLVIVCQPNNPTGTVLSTAGVERLMAHVPSDCLVVLDEAYVEYVRDPRAANGFALQLQDRWPNLVVLRTFSKAYSLAGLRVGYLLGDPAVVAHLRAASVPFSLSAPAQAAAVAALGLRGQFMDRADQVVAERGRVRKALLAQGWRVPDSEANFLWLEIGEPTAAFVRWCAERGIAVRGFPGEGIRVSLGASAGNDAFLAACEEWLKETRL